MSYNYNLLPFLYEKKNTEFKRLIVEPVQLPETTSSEGVVNPKHDSSICEVGKVFAVCEGSDFKKGDEVFYNKIDRTSGEHLDTIRVDNILYDVVYEQEIWCHNEKPFGRIFVQPLSEIEISEGGLMIPGEVKGITQKGVVFLSDKNYNLNPGDHVEYRKQEVGMFPEIILDGVLYNVIYEADIFKINDSAAPYRIIIQIDKVAQRQKRSSTPSGVALSPLFIAMLYNLQYGKVLDIGEEAKKMYPTISVGDTIIIHHAIEEQPYRLIAQEKNEDDAVLYEHRIINCWEEKSREVFGKLHFEHNTGKIIDISPLNDNVFLKWDFSLLERTPENAANLDSGYNLNKFTNVDTLRNALKFRKQLAAEKAKQKISGLKITLSQLNPEFDKDRYDLLDSEYRTIEREETAYAKHLSKDHLVVCAALYPKRIPKNVITPYEELYPINILGNKYLIANPDFLIAQTHKIMNITSAELQPLGDNVFVRPLDGISDSALLIPDSAKEKPQTGTVVAIGENDKVKKEDTVLFRKFAGVEVKLDGEKVLILQRNDLIAVVTPA